MHERKKKERQGKLGEGSAGGCGVGKYYEGGRVRPGSAELCLVAVISFHSVLLCEAGARWKDDCAVFFASLRRPPRDALLFFLFPFHVNKQKKISADRDLRE